MLTVTSLPDPALSGTLAEDVFVNTSYRFDGSPYDLRSVVLHEAGHALGLDHSADPASPMSPRFNNTNGTLTGADVQAIRKLYGTRRPDRFEGAAGNGTTGTATRIPVPGGYTGTTPLLAHADLSTAADADVYRVVAPAGSQPVALVANVWALPGRAAGTRVELLDASEAVVPAEILVNDSGAFTVQATGLTPGATLLVRVTGGANGNYLLTADFRPPAADARTFAEGGLATAASRTDTVYVGQSQLFHFALTATGPAGTAVRMTVLDAGGDPLFTLTANAGDTVSVSGRVFRPGEYRVRYEAVGGPVGFRLRGNRITDPVGPVVDDPTLQPTYRDPNSPGGFEYPNGTATLSPWLWLFADV